MKLKHILSARQFDKKTLENLFNLADQIRKGKFDKNALSGKIMASLFYEPSTRTRLSFESAMQRLGGRIISTENASEFSSAAKGETLEDTIRVIGAYCDVIVLRHILPGASQTAAKYARVPIINAGDGEGEHPTQALLDLYTIFSKIEKRNLTVAMVGDLKFGRTVHSLSYLLSLYPNVKLIFVSPKFLTIPDPLKSGLKKASLNFEEVEDLRYALKICDVCYMTRIQKERFKNTAQFSKYFGQYILDKNNLKFLKKEAIIMHPLPRVNEISKEVDFDRRAIYFDQVENGIYIRMAILLSLFDKTSKHPS